MINYILLFNKFFKAKWNFQKPKKKKFLIYDIAHSGYLFHYIKKKESAIYYTRWEEINFFILYNAITNYGFKNLRNNYKKIFFNYVEPKIAITLMTSYTAFYELKKQFPNITTIAIQSDVGNDVFFRTIKAAKKNTFSCDYFLFFSDSFKKLYEKYIKIKKKSIVIGSLKNNYYNNKNINDKKILFISKANKGSRVKNEIILLRNIIEYLKKNKESKIDLCLKTDHTSIIEYFKNGLNSNYVNIIPKKNSYLLIRHYRNIIFTDSTLGYECLSRGKKIISFGLGSLKKKWCIDNGFNPIHKFGYPNIFKNEGFCWSNTSSKKRIDELLKNILSMKQSAFKKKINKNKKSIMFFDPNNTKFKKLLCAV